MKIESKQLENEILSSTCNECGRGHFRRGETELEFRRIYDRVIAVDVHIASVPALICDECHKEIILPEVEQSIWNEFEIIENSGEFKALIEKAKDLLRRTKVKQATQSLNIIYTPTAAATPA